jgi:trigger factor
LALVEGCKHSLEFSVPVAELEGETNRVISDVQKKAKLPGFRPGKAPASIIRSQFAGEIRQQVLESVIPKALQKQFEAENLSVVGTPDITDVHFHQGEPLKFKATFEVFPEIELGDYKGVEVPYHDPEVTDEDINKRVEEIREQKAQYINIDPRPLEDGDHAVVSLESIEGVEGEPVKTDEMVLELAGKDTFPAFTENLRGLSPDDEKDFEVSYPEDYGAERLAG